MMIKIYLFASIILLVSCDKIKSKESNNFKETISKQDSIINEKEFIVSSQTNIEFILNKLENNKPLQNQEYDDLCSYILKNEDESISENLGYLIFQYFKENKINSERFSLFLVKKNNSYKNNILSNLIDVMGIDLVDANYTYENLITDFNFFADNLKVKETFEILMKNQVN